MSTATKPSVLFVCVHNAGRSQMAAAYTHHLSGGAVEVPRPIRTRRPGVNPSAVEIQHGRRGHRHHRRNPKILTTDAVQSSDVVITMGCGDTCPIFPGKRYGTGNSKTRRQGRRLRPPHPRRHQAAGPDLLDELGVTPVSA